MAPQSKASSKELATVSDMDSNRPLKKRQVSRTFEDVNTATPDETKIETKQSNDQSEDANQDLGTVESVNEAEWTQETRSWTEINAIDGQKKAEDAKTVDNPWVCTEKETSDLQKSKSHWAEGEIKMLTWSDIQDVIFDDDFDKDMKISVLEDELRNLHARMVEFKRDIRKRNYLIDIWKAKVEDSEDECERLRAKLKEMEEKQHKY